MRLLTLPATIVLAAALAGCGSVSSPADEAAVKPVQLSVSPAKFSRTTQGLGEAVTLTLTVTNTGRNPAPTVVVALKGLEETTSEDPRDETRERTTKDDLPNATKRAPWFIDQAPLGGAYGSSNLFEGGALAPGRSRTLRWKLVSQQPGRHTLEYQVLAGLTDNAARATQGTGLKGSVSATIRPNATG